MNGRFYMILILGKNISQYMQGSALHKPTGRDANLVRLPPSEAALRQHILRASFQTKVWHTSCLTKPPLPSPLKLVAMI
jgi:hypothetical protein